MSESQEKIVKVLSKGQNTTADQLRRKTGINGISQRIAELRQNGYPNIYTNKVGGQSFYRLGNPTKAMKKAARAGKLALAS
jgi:predicted HTH transcriptional regulator